MFISLTCNLFHICFFFLFCLSTFRVLCPMLPVSLDCSFLVVPPLFSNTFKYCANHQRDFLENNSSFFYKHSVNGALFILVKRPSDCGELDKSTCKSGVYKIYPKNTSGFEVYCEMEKNSGVWTVSDVMLLAVMIRWQELVSYSC